MPDSAQKTARDKAEPTGVQSIEVGAALLREIARASGPLKLTELAAASGMSASRAYKYLASYVRCGLVHQSQPSGRYGIGPLAAELGFAALRSMDVAELAQETLDNLRDQAHATASLAIWSAQGPMVIRRAVYDQTVSLIVQLGAVVNILTSSNGRVFAAFAAETVTTPLIEKELAHRGGPAERTGIFTLEDVTSFVTKVRANGFSAMEGAMMQQGIVSASAPVFDHTGQIVASVALTGFGGQLDISGDGEPVRFLLSATNTLSRRLGAAVS